MAEMTFLPETNLTPEAALEAANEIISALDKEARMNIYASAIKTIEEFKGSDTFLQKFRKEVEANDGEEAWESLRNAEETIQTALENRALIYSLEKFFPDADPLALSYAGAQISVEARKAEKSKKPAYQRFRQSNIKPTTRHDPTTKVAQKITKLEPNRQYQILVHSDSEKKKGQEVVTFVEVNQDMRLTRQLTNWDRHVNNAVTSLYKAGVETFTPAQVWAALSGRDADRATAKQISEVEESLDEQRKAILILDFEQEARGRTLLDADGKPFKRCRIETYFLNADKIEIEASNGKVVTGYQLKDAPALYRHANALGQVATYPAKLLETDAAGSNTKTNMAIKGYLLERITLAKGGRMPNRIRYATIFEHAEIESPDRKKRSAIAKYVSGCLDIWQEQGFIKSWSEYKKGQTREGIEVDF